VKACLTSPGRFTAFDLGRELTRRGVLARMYTAYPMFKMDEDLRARSSARPWCLVAREVASRLRLRRLARRLQTSTMLGLDRWVAGRLEPCDVTHCMSGFGLATHQVARARFGAVTVCDRGSTHIVEQDRLLREEYDLWGIPFGGVDAAVVERELAEYDLCDRVVVPSRFVERSFLERGIPAGRVHRIPFGVDVRMFHPEPRRDGPFRILFAGRIGLRKGIGYLLQAAAEWSRAGVAELWLAGGIEPEAQALLRQYEGAFTYLGQVPRDRLRWYYAQTSVLVLPSIEEGLALVLAQALACGLPVVATPNTGAEDLVTDGREGLLVPIRDVAALQAAIDSLRTDRDLLEHMREAALRRASGLRGWGEYGDQVVALYASLIDAR
jgi:starch synthase